MIDRRELLSLGLGALSLGAAGLGVARLARAQAPPEESGLDPRLTARLELRSAYARKTENLVAAYLSRRTSSMLVEPLVTTGRLVYVAPGRLMLRDDALTGSTTRIEGGRVSLVSNQQDSAAAAEDPEGRHTPVDPKGAPGLFWLRDRLLGLFDPDDGSALIAGTEATAPRGRKARIELRPPGGTLVRKVVRSVMVTLDPVGGAVLSVSIAEAQGDTFELDLSDHRQNVEDEEIERLLERR